MTIGAANLVSEAPSMADDLHYVGGDNYLLDDLSGFKIRASRARVIPGGQTGQLAVAPQRWEPQQPQDFVRGVWDDETVQLARPRQQNRFVIVGTQVSAFASAGSTTIEVQGTNGFAVNSRCQVVLDNGNIFFFRLTAIGTNSLTFFGQPLPSAVGGSFADPLENMVVQIAPIDSLVFILGVAGSDILGLNVLG
jgi:hypothetical protein